MLVERAIVVVDAGEWPSGFRRWLVGFRSDFGPGSIPSQAKIVIVISCAPWQGRLNPVGHGGFLRCLPDEGGTTPTEIGHPLV